MPAGTYDEALNTLLDAARDAIPRGWTEGLLRIEAAGNTMNCGFLKKMGGVPAPVTNAIVVAAVDYYTLMGEGGDRWGEARLHFGGEVGEGQFRVEYKPVPPAFRDRFLAITHVNALGTVVLPKEPREGAPQSKAEAEWTAAENLLRAAAVYIPEEWSSASLRLFPKEGGVDCSLSRSYYHPPLATGPELQELAEALIALMAPAGLPWTEASYGMNRSGRRIYCSCSIDYGEWTPPASVIPAPARQADEPQGSVSDSASPSETPVATQEKNRAEHDASLAMVRAALACAPSDWRQAELFVIATKPKVACRLTSPDHAQPAPISRELQAKAQAFRDLSAGYGTGWIGAHYVITRKEDGGVSYKGDFKNPPEGQAAPPVQSGAPKPMPLDQAALAARKAIWLAAAIPMLLGFVALVMNLIKGDLAAAAVGAIIFLAPPVLLVWTRSRWAAVLQAVIAGFFALVAIAAGMGWMTVGGAKSLWADLLGLLLAAAAYLALRARGAIARSATAQSSSSS